MQKTIIATEAKIKAAMVLFAIGERDRTWITCNDGSLERFDEPDCDGNVLWEYMHPIQFLFKHMFERCISWLSGRK